MDEPTVDLRAAYLDLQKAQTRLDEDRAKVREQMLAAEPTWGPCLQCGHTWRSTKIRRRIGKPPRMCPKCRSHYWFDPEYVPRVSQVPPAGKSAAGAEQHTDDHPIAPAAPTTGMPPPPRFELEDTLDLMHKVDEDKS